MAQAVADRQRRIAVLKRVVAAEREILLHPAFGIAAGRLIAEAKHELAVLEAQPIARPPRLVSPSRHP